MATTIDIKNLQKKLSLSLPKVRRNVGKILRAKGVTRAELSLVFVTDRKIKILNTHYLQHRYATDVIAFDFTGRKFKRNPLGQPIKKVKDVSGEIIISTQRAIRQAKEFDTTPQAEVTLYLIHGVLHLLGYDDHNRASIKAMRKEEQKILKVL